MKNKSSLNLVDTASQNGPQVSWLQSFRVYLTAPALRMLFLGFSAGLPLLLVLGTLSFRLREAGIDRATIGFLSWVGLAYALKWVWAPLVDHVNLPWLTRLLGKRRSWLLFSQLLVIIGLIGMALGNPQESFQTLIYWSVWVAFASATQDIALDAFRIESAEVKIQAALAATYQTGYRIAMIWAGAGSLWVAAQYEVASLTGYQQQAWQIAYFVMALSMLTGCLTVFLSPEPVFERPLAARQFTEWIKEALVAPFSDFIHRFRWQAVLILALIGVYRISDVVMGIMANPFYVDMGYTKEEVAAVSKIFGVLMTLVGAFIGGILSLRIGMMRSLMLGALLSAASNLLFAWLTGQGHNLHALIWVVSADNLAGGVASSAFVAYLSGLTRIKYSATQYALFSSMMLLAPKWLAGFSGVYVDTNGYPSFFVATALLGLPVLVLVAFAARIKEEGR
jgi:PAT family beta-lactamase induction signal transducer AmpG